MGAGVPARTAITYQLMTWASAKPASANVGTSGRVASRLSPRTASARSLPFWTC